VRLLFVHGWGFDAAIWDRLVALLPECSSERTDRGYFGAPYEPPFARSFIAVTHSFGSMRMLCDPPAGCRGLVAINGFDRFVAGSDWEGVSARVLDRMIARFGKGAPAVLLEFRRRCGCAEPFKLADLDRLQEDLLSLRDLDGREHATRFPFPILSLQGEADPILPAGLRDACFGSALSVSRASSPDGGHILPLTDADFCAEQIRLFAKTCQ
jgi:pimeloyl-[acyl-carrier protein] methyl ester esterase